MLPPNLARALAKGTVMSCFFFFFFFFYNFDGGASSSYHSMVDKVIKKLPFVINAWPLTLKIFLHQQEPKFISTEM